MADKQLNDSIEIPIKSKTSSRSSRKNETTQITLGRAFSTEKNYTNIQSQPPHTTKQSQLSQIYESNSSYYKASSSNSPIEITMQRQVENLEEPIFKNGIPVANPRAKKRAKSYETWLDHRPIGFTKLDAVMQPRMRRKISVARIELNDAKKSSRYLLRHQQQDNDGEIITNLIKGDIMKSATGGANCIFTEIETLKIKSNDKPKPLKNIETSENLIENGIRTKKRCSMGIEGHDYNGNSKYDLNRNYTFPKV